jgi:hypothetical protein
LNQEETPKPEANNIPKGLLKKVIVLLPRIQKGTKILINTLKTPNPATILQNQWIKDNSSYLTIIEMGNAIVTSIVGQVK